MNAVIYARYSSDSQREESIEGQLRECREYAERNNMTIVGTYIDRALSAKTADRPEFQHMIKDSAKELFEIVLVWKLDRFSRDRYDSAHYKHILKKNGVKVISAKEHISEGPEGIILEAMLEGYAEFYSAELSEKIHRGQKENALKGKNNGGGVPLGYLLDKKAQKLLVDPVTAPLVVEIFEKYADGKTVRSIVEDFNARGLRTKKGQPFNINSFSSLLKNRKYIGEYRYQDVVIEGGVPAIVPEDLFNRVQERMEKNRHAPAMAKAKEDYLLTTKRFCGKYERMMVGESGKSHTGAMHCFFASTGVLGLLENLTRAYPRAFGHLSAGCSALMCFNSRSKKLPSRFFPTVDAGSGISSPPIAGGLVPPCVGNICICRNRLVCPPENTQRKPSRSAKIDQLLQTRCPQPVLRPPCPLWSRTFLRRAGSKKICRAQVCQRGGIDAELFGQIVFKAGIARVDGIERALDAFAPHAGAHARHLCGEGRGDPHLFECFAKRRAGANAIMVCQKIIGDDILARDAERAQNERGGNARAVFAGGAVEQHRRFVRKDGRKQRFVGGVFKRHAHIALVHAFCQKAQARLAAHDLLQIEILFGAVRGEKRVDRDIFHARKLRVWCKGALRFGAEIERRADAQREKMLPVGRGM